MATRDRVAIIILGARLRLYEATRATRALLMLYALRNQNFSLVKKKKTSRTLVVKTHNVL